MRRDVDGSVAEKAGSRFVFVAWKNPRSAALGVVTEAGGFLGASGPASSVGHANLEVEPAALAIVLYGGRFAIPARVVQKNLVVHL